MAARAVALIAVAACLGCGKPVSSTPPASAPVQPGAAEPEIPPDLSPVAAPEDLVLVGRLSRPRLLFETLANWSGVPVRLADVLPGEARELSKVIAWDAPVEVLAVLDREASKKSPVPLFVLSVGLSSSEGALELARSRGINVTSVAPGIARLRAGDDVACAVSVAVGSAPGRLVCGDEWRDVEELLPYATRGLPSADLGTSDLHVELRVAPIQRLYAQELAAIRPLAGILLRNMQTDSKRFDRALTDVVYALADEVRALATEIQSLQVNARLDEPKKVLDVGYALALNGNASVSGQLMRDAGRRAASAPEAFWQFPSAAETAMYQVASDPKRVEQWVATLGELADAYLEQKKAAPLLRKRLRSVLESFVPGYWTTWSTASGPVEDAAAASALDTILHRGWAVTVIEGRADRVTKVLSELSRLVADPGLVRLFKEHAELGPKAIPKIRQGTAKVPGFDARGTLYTVELPPALLDAISDDKTAPARAADAPPKKAEAKTKKATLVLLVVPDGERSWIGYGPDQKTAIQGLEAARTGKEPKLASVPELEVLRGERAILAGYWTLASVLSSLRGVAKEHGKAAELESLLARMPNRGRSPWLLRAGVTEQGSAVTLTSQLRIPQGAFQDAGSVGFALISELAAALKPESGRLADSGPQ